MRTKVLHCSAEVLHRSGMPNLVQLSKTALWNVVAPKPLSRALQQQQQTSTCRIGSSPTAQPPRRLLRSSAAAQRVSPLSDPENKGQRQPGVNFDAVGSWNNHLDLQVNVQQSIKRGKLVPEIRLENVASASLIGRRKENEDRILICQVRPELKLFAVFDGHGGPQAADYAQKHLVDHLNFWIDRGERDLEVILQKSFVDLNNIFTRHLHKKYQGDDSAMGSGTTATVCLLQDDIRLVVGHVGDSRAVLCRDGVAMKLTPAHTPDDEAELRRVKAAGGYVTFGSIGEPRINGRLEMTRSIGDIELKAFGVTAWPHTEKMLLRHSHDAFLVLCTDGVHNALNSQELVDIICSSRDPEEAARFSSSQALHFGSEDNSTTVVVPFGSWGKFGAANQLKVGVTKLHVGSRFN